MLYSGTDPESSILQYRKIHARGLGLTARLCEKRVKLLDLNYRGPKQLVGMPPRIFNGKTGFYNSPFSGLKWLDSCGHPNALTTQCPSRGIHASFLEQ